MNRAIRILTHGWLDTALSVLTQGYFANVPIEAVDTVVYGSIMGPGATGAIAGPGATGTIEG